MMHLPELETSYAAINPFGRKLLREIAAGFAIDFPAPKKTASLLLVANGARLDPCEHDVGKTVNRFPMVVASKPMRREET